MNPFQQMAIDILTAPEPKPDVVLTAPESNSGLEQAADTVVASELNADRKEAVKILSVYLTEEANNPVSPNGEFLDNVIGMFSKGCLDTDEQKSIAPFFKPDMIDHGLESSFATNGFANLKKDYQQLILDYTGQGVKKILSEQLPHRYEYKGNYIDIMWDPSRTGDDTAKNYIELKAPSRLDAAMRTHKISLDI